jgi:glycosyltransferase involved in cell wall biosynthesis
VIRVLLDARKARDFGIGRYVLGLLSALDRRGEFALTAAVLPGDEALLPPRVAGVVCAADHYTLRELVEVRSVIRRVRPDLFHAPHYVVPFDPPAATVVTVHDLMHLHRPEHASPLRRGYARFMMSRALRLAAKVIAVSEATKKEILAFGPEHGGKVEVVPNGVDERFFLEGEERNSGARQAPAAPARLSSSEGPYLLYLGNDKPHKNLDGLLGALAALRRTEPDLEILLAGVSRARAVPPGARALGFVADAELPPLLRGARALVLASFAEGFGLPVAEAMATGTPVACSDLPALREVAGDAAVYFDPRDGASIARVLADLLGDEGKRDRLRARGRERAAALTWDAAAERTARLYRDVLAEVSAGAGGIGTPPGSR